MKMLLAIVGFFLGLAVGPDSPVLGSLSGTLIGYLIGSVRQLRARVESLEFKQDRSAPAAGPPGKPRAVTVNTPDATNRAQPSPAPELDASAEQPRTETQAGTPPSERFPKKTISRVPDFGQRLFATARRWMTTGNVPVKLGVIVFFFGVAFLFKYAVDHKLLTIPIWLRHVVVAVTGLVMLGIGWRLRNRARVFALSLQGGGFGVLYLTIFAAMRLFDLIPAGLAFSLLVVLTGGAGILAVVQEARGMAILGVIGGFLTPILVSSGEGDHVILFSYYFVLNASILGIAWFRAWRDLNLIGFAFTFAIAGWWGYHDYVPEHFWSTETLLVLHFLLYQGVAILFAFRQQVNLKGMVDGTLVFGTPVIAFALQATLVEGFEHGLSASALAVGLFHALTATLLFRFQREKMRLLIESFAALSVAFLTLAIPLEFDARWTSAAWALEGAALVWLGVRQQRTLARAAGVLLLIGSGVAFLQHGWQEGAGRAVLNGNLSGGLLIGLAALISARLLEGRVPAPRSLALRVARMLFVWGAVWWLGTGLMEIHERVVHRFEPASAVLFLAACGAILTIVATRCRWSTAGAGALLLLPALFYPAALLLSRSGHPCGDLGWFAWPLAIAAHFWALRAHAADGMGPRVALHAATPVAIAALLAWESHWQIDRLEVGPVWASVAAALVPGLIATAMLHPRLRIRWPLKSLWRTYGERAGSFLIAVQLLALLVLNLHSPGNPDPLAYLPVLNPLDLATLIGFLLTMNWLLPGRGIGDRWSGKSRQSLKVSLVTFAFVTSTAVIIRAVHHLGEIPWDPRLLFDSVVVQSSLSVFWGVLGFAGMVWGARKQQRSHWIAGAVMMGVVVAKLFVIDLRNTGSVERIVSFIAVGILLLVVGYFAPAPPRGDPEAAPTSK